MKKKNVPIKIKQSTERLITPSGMLLIGQLLKKTKLGSLLNKLGKAKNVKHQNSSCVIGYIGLLCQGKTAYDDMREMQEDPSFYCQALHINSIASPETTRQRLDYLGIEIASTNMIMEESAALINTMGIEPTPSFSGHVALDFDVSVHDNSQTKKEGVERTYMGIDGYAPMYAYIGGEGYMCNLELREGSCHSQCEGTVDFVKDTIRLAKGITTSKLLARMDSGNDSLDNIKLFVSENVDFVIKRNLRSESVEEWFKTAQENSEGVSPREGKTIYTGSIFRKRKGVQNPVRIVFKVTVRTIDKSGQVLILPYIDVQTWWTSLDDPEDEVIRQYCEHATCEQFHSEIKTDIGLERFPSGNFDTNAAILKLAGLAYNLLRIISHNALEGSVPLTRKQVGRLRAKTVIQRFMSIAGHVTSHARQTFLSLGRSNIWRDAFVRLYTAYA